MIRIERDPAFWRAVAEHPEVASRLGAPMSGAALAALVTDAATLPLASEHGGHLFVRRDPLGFAAELHTLFTPEGWGREALEAARLAFDAVFHIGFQAVITHEAQANRKSQPPLSFGFRRAGDWRETAFGNLRLWVLTTQAWAASPAAKRRRKPCH